MRYPSIELRKLDTLEASLQPSFHSTTCSITQCLVMLIMKEGKREAWCAVWGGQGVLHVYGEGEVCYVGRGSCAIWEGGGVLYGEGEGEVVESEK